MTLKALILNSGQGKRMGDLTNELPKCMAPITENDTILSRQLKQLELIGVSEIIITTGFFHQIIVDYCYSLELSLKYTFVNNDLFDKTNYIFSIYKARTYISKDDIILLHGDLVFDDIVLQQLVCLRSSSMVVSSTADLPEKDFKAVVIESKISKVGIEFFESAIAAQPLYYLLENDLKIWLERIIIYCERGMVNCYAENALNEVTSFCNIQPFDTTNLLCNEIDTPIDLFKVKDKLKNKEKTVYMCFSTDIIHSGHIDIIRKAAKLGKLIVGILTDEVVASYKRFPLIPFVERMELMKNINGVEQVVTQEVLSYAENLRKYRPDYVVHGDDWKNGFQKSVREEVICVLNEFGGSLVEYPYSRNEIYTLQEKKYRDQLSIPDFRRGRLKRLLEMKKTVSIIESHSGITGLIAENTTVFQDGKIYQFDGMWVSSLCDSTAKGKPDIELVDMSSRLRTIDDIMDVTTKPIILDGDTGGQIEHFVYNVRTLERIGVSAIIIEDKTGLKKNSLFGTEVEQTQDTIENFSAKIKAGKNAQKTKEFMIIARIESLILEKGMTDALERAASFVEAGADGIMIHSRKKDPSEIFEFCNKFREFNSSTYLVVVPTSFDEVTEEELSNHGVNIIIYANQLTRSGFPAMQKTAEAILFNHRAKEANDLCMSIKDILNLIPDES